MSNQFLNVPLQMGDNTQHLRLVAQALNSTIDGKLNSTGSITLSASATSTTLTDARIGGNSIILFMPVTANGRTALNGMHISARASGSATLTHASSSNSDQNLAYCIIG